jgi:hypothetical protein
MNNDMPSLAKQPEKKFKKPRQMKHREKLRLDVTKYLTKKLAQKLNLPSIQQLPWKKMLAGDIVNWPPEVEFEKFDRMNTEELRKIHELVQEDKLDFSQEFISRLKIKRKGTGKRVVLKSDVTKYLAKKLAKKLNVESIKVPWSQMTAGDIINWPPEVELKRFDKISSDHQRKIHELAKEDKLDFSQEFISWLKIKRKETDKRVVLRSYLTKYLQDKLAEKLNVESIKKLPWSEMTAKDIINWPPDVELRNVNGMSTADAKRLHELARKGLLDFSQEFISRLETKKSRGSNRLRPYLTKYLQDKLAEHLNVDSIKVPWSQMTAKDIINWPPDMEFRNVNRMSTEELNRLLELAKKDLLDFSPEFLKLRASLGNSK